MEMNWSELDLPGFRFHPTEEELLEFYLKGAVRGKKLQPEIIHTLNIYRYHPVELPGMARNIGEREWYFFVPRDRRSSNCGRPSRTTDKGFWKATGSDRTIRSAADPRRKIGMKKTLVFYEGRAPRGTRTDWVMNEYRLPEVDNTTADVSSTRASDIAMLQVDMVLCKIYRKATSMRELEQRAAMDKDACRGGATAAQCGSNSSNTSGATTTLMISSSSSDQKTTAPLHKSRTLPVVQQLVMGEEVETKEITMKVETLSTETEKDQAAEVTSLAVVGSGDPAAALTRTTTLPELDKLLVPPREGFFDWAQHDPFLAQLRSPWLDNWSPLYASILNFSS